MEVKASLLTLRSSNGTTELCINCERFLHYLACALCVVTGINILSSCLFSIHCSQILPAISYLACYKGHERLAVFSFVIYGLCLGVLVFTLHAKLSENMTRLEKALLMLLGLVVMGIIPAVIIVDELNGLYFAPLDFVHSYLLYGLLVCGVCWAYLAYSCLSDQRASMTTKEAADLSRLLKWIVGTIIMTLFTIVQWQVGYSIYSNFWFNENTFALCEWTTIAMAAFLPSKFCRVCGDSRMLMSVQDFCKRESGDDDITPAQESFYSVAE